MQSQRLFRPGAAVLAGVLASVMVLAVPAVAAPVTPSVDPSTPPRLVNADEGIGRVAGLDASMMALMKRQDRASQVGAAIQNSARTSPGLSGIRSDGKGGLEVFWHGPIPAAVTGQVIAGKNAGVVVRVLPAPFTKADLLAEADRISRLSLPAGVQSIRVAPKPDGTGVEVALAGSATVGVAATRWAGLVPGLGGGRIPLTVTDMPEPVFDYRYIDASPFYGGSLIEREGWNNQCSSAFGVTGLNGVSTYMVSAAHCGEGTWLTGDVELPDGTTWWNEIGRVVKRDTGRDVQLIAAAPGATAGAGIYWGASINPPDDPGSNDAVAVAGVGPNFVGNYICNSGAYSGTICGSQIITTDVTITYTKEANGVQRVTNLVFAMNLPADENSAFSGQGDSGGPMVSITSDGRVRALGVASGHPSGPYVRPCKGYNYPGRECSYASYYADLSSALGALGVRINTP
jgi:streptogrisin D